MIHDLRRGELVARELDLFTLDLSAAEIAAIASRLGAPCPVEWVELRVAVRVYVPAVERGDWETPDYWAPPELLDFRVVAVELWEIGAHEAFRLDRAAPLAHELAELSLCHATEEEIVAWLLDD